MANSPLVSVRIPLETLERIDLLAQKLYPSRRIGKKPNRSQVILDAIEQFLAQQESISVLSPDFVHDFERQGEDQTMAFLVNKETDLANRLSMNEKIDDRLLAKIIQENPTYLEPSIRDYIDWWLDYFLYMKRFTNVWLRTKK